MLRIRAIPCLLLRNRRLVKTVRFGNARYVGDPVNAIKIFNEKEVDEIIVLDIGATAAGRAPDFELIGQLTDECFMPLCYGGGITNRDQAKRLFSLGIEKVAINSVALERPSVIEEIASEVGSQSVVVSIDVKRGLLGRYNVRTHSGSRKTDWHPVEYARMVERRGAGEILLTAIDRDGTWNGYDVELTARVCDAVSIPVIASGGAGSVADFGTVVTHGGASAVAAGSMAVYQGKGLGVLIGFPSHHDVERAVEQDSGAHSANHVAATRIAKTT
jgi:cyclase